MKRVRYLELAKIADDICVMLLEKKVAPNEGCMIRQIAETQWGAMRASHDELRQIPEMSNAVCADVPSEIARLSDSL